MTTLSGDLGSEMPERDGTIKACVMIGLVLVIGMIGMRWLAANEAISGLASWSAFDGSYVMVAVVEWLNNGVFANSLTNYYTEPHWRDGTFSMVGYAPLHMLLLGVLSPTADVHGVFMGVWILEASGLILAFATLIALVLRMGAGRDKMVWLLVLLGLACLGTLGFSGRPGSTFLILLWVGLLYLVCDAKPRPVLIGILLGMLGATQPTAALIVSAAIVIWTGMVMGTREAARYLVVVGCLSLVSVMVFIGTYYGSFDVLGAMRRNLPNHVFSWFSPELWFRTSFLDYKRPLAGCVMIAGVVGFALIALRFRPRSTVWFLIGLVLLAGTCTHAFIARPHSTYNVHAIYPVFILLTIFAATRSKWASRVGLVLLTLSALALPLQALTFADQVHRGTPLRSAQVIYEAALAGLPDEIPIAVDPSLWGLSADGGDWDRTFYLNWEGPRNQDASDAVLFAREGAPLNRSQSLTDPPPVRIRDDENGINHTLWLDCNTRRTVRLLGQEIYTPVGGFSFSVYLPDGLLPGCGTGINCIAEVRESEFCSGVVHD